MKKINIKFTVKLIITTIFLALALALAITFTEYYATYDLVITSFLTKPEALIAMIVTWFVVILAIYILVRIIINFVKTAKPKQE